ncbi:hypothetical protein FGADI_11641 [Fusarium gaditjirri]|uniref:Uncharacterized protein n=1 Tax=Fusarium gaditjirri TaxID=282569 RepID=A0A8H4WQ64_9HYPO|nr:hypothetical protein FGADI_11641 [Fusarium gaditjirri]
MELEFRDPEWAPPRKDFPLWGLYHSCILCSFDFTRGEPVISYEVDTAPIASIFPDDSRVPVPLCHPECVTLATPTLLPDGRLDPDIAHLNYREGRIDEPEDPCGARLRWLQDSFAHNLFEILRGRLPQQVCRNIATHCIRERAVQVIQEQWLAPGRSQKGYISVPIRHGVALWAQYIRFEGKRCIQSFSYESRGGDEEMLLEGNSRGPLNIFIRQHSLGIDKIVVTEGTESPRAEQVEAYWWTVYVQQNPIFYLKARYDGIKVRDLVLVKSSGDFLNFRCCLGPCEVLWAIPPTVVKYSPKIPLPIGIGETFVRSFEWNKPGTLGYSFVLCSDIVLQFNSHGIGHPAAFDEYQVFDPNEITWLYFPMGPDERVSELWLRQYPEKNATLILVTDQGRSLVLGSQQHEPGATYHPIARLPHDKPCSMLYAHAFILTWIHIDAVSTWENPQTRQIHPDWRSDFNDIYTSAKLDGLRDVTPCIQKGPFVWGEGEIITGLLLTYYDGSRSCIGDVRYDRLGTPEKVTSDTMWIRYVEHSDVVVPEGEYYAVDVGIEWFGFSQPRASSYFHEESNTTSEPDSSTDGTSEEDDSVDEGSPAARWVRLPQYLTVPLRGRLDWAKSPDSSISVLSHHERSEPNDEMLHVLSEDVKLGRAESVVKSITCLLGDISPKNLEDFAKDAAKTDNYDTFGL